MSTKRKIRSSPRKPETNRAGASSAEQVFATAEVGKREVKSSFPFSSKWVCTLAPVTLAVLVSINTLWNGWVTDDHMQILRNEAIRKLSNIPRSFVTSVWSYAQSDIKFSVDTYYRPMFMSLFTINYSIVGLTPWAWHLINVLIHTAATLLVFFTIKELTKQPGIAAITSGLFAVHPTHAESVAWVSGITDPLMSLFLLPAFWCYLRFRNGGSKYLIAPLALFYLLALFSKETALALPLVIAYCEVFYFKELAPLKVRVVRAVLLPGLLVVPTAAYIAMRHVALSGELLGSGQRYPLELALMTTPLAIVKYLKLMLLPMGQSYQHYTEFVHSIAAQEFILPVAAIAGLIAVLAITRSRLAIFGSIWFIVTLAPALAAIRHFDREYLLQDRYLYLPSIGYCLVLALLTGWLAKRYSWKAGAAAAAVMLIAYGVADVRQNRVWKDGTTVFQNCVDVDPDSAEAHLSLSRVYFEAGLVKSGEDHARKALELQPGNPNPYLTLSYFSKASGKLGESIEYLERGISAIEETPLTRFKLATMYLNLGLLQAQNNQLASAEQSVVRSVELWPRATGWYYAGQFYFDQGRYREALAMFEAALGDLTERYPQVHLKMGLAYDRLGEQERARAEYERYLELFPNAPDRLEVSRRLSQL